ncbi:MAG TPA: ammonia monooxygenase, partial [Synergistaceae bacterium]|nr:ammonia monooxygenase [Synergistaceae bacterium]
MENWYVALAVLLGGYLGHISPIPAGGLVGGIVGGLLLKGGLGMGESKVALLSFVSQVLVAFVIVARSDLSSLKDL